VLDMRHDDLTSGGDPLAGKRQRREGKEKPP
jgi:hypothetical protein